MRFDDRIIGVIVLSKLGLDQFIRDDLRYLEIYASMAAQAMANADTTQLLRAQSELLARQLAAQRELMRATESILSTLDPRAVMEEIAERIGGLVHVDMLALTVREPTTGALQTLFSRGDDPDVLPSESHPDTRAISDWVVRHAATLRLQADVAPPRHMHLVRDGSTTRSWSARFAARRVSRARWCWPDADRTPASTTRSWSSSSCSPATCPSRSRTPTSTRRRRCAPRPTR